MDPEKENLEFPSSLGMWQKIGNDDGKRDFPQGILAHLEMLEFRARREAVEQEEKEQREEKSQFLKSKIRELRLQRDRLRDKLEQLEKPLEKAGIPSDPPLPGSREVLEWKIRDLQSLLRVFQLTGVSGSVSKHGLCFSILTAFRSSILASFHVELQLQPQLRFLPRDLRAFLELLCAHLNGFMGRRHQLEQLQERFPDCLVGAPRGNSLCNLLSFRYRVPGKNRELPEFRARLLYRDPCGTLPSDVTVTCACECGDPPQRCQCNLRQ
ncbi:centromere protein O-like [Malurus melanocephalus]|uniref:centromere protein O-like n=1 Tax=Malurus melanocephalus TaxID=175006 RepID=UPI0025488063|nr:centromere protein O-like [Malurus melanocephalus]